MSIDDAMAFVKSKAGIQFDPAVVELLAEHYPRLEEMARQQIEEVEPLKTDLFIERGAAPGNGFEPEQAGQTSSAAAGLGADALLKLSHALESSTTIPEAGAILGERLQPIVPFDCLVVYIKHEETVSAHYIGGAGARAFSKEPIPVGAGLSGWVVLSGRAIVNGNPTVEPNFVAANSTFTAESSALSVPLMDQDGRVVGALTVYARNPAAFSKDHLRILEAVRSHLAQPVESESQPVLAGSSAR
jgi:GAF domain-containing protein